MSKLENLVNEIMSRLNFDDLEIRELESGCDFNGTLEHYKSRIKDELNRNEDIDKIVENIQESIDDDYSCLE